MLGRNSIDTDFGVVLTMALGASVTFATAHLEHLDFIVTALCKNGSFDRCASDEGSADFQLFAFADQLEAKVAAAKSRIDHLTQSILAKAFRGELVAQDPNDEPASVLLERIKAQRAAAPKAKRGRKASV